MCDKNAATICVKACASGECASGVCAHAYVRKMYVRQACVSGMCAPGVIVRPTGMVFQLLVGHKWSVTRQVAFHAQ